MWNSFTVYFNRFYNAEKAFELGEEEIQLNSKKALFAFKEEKLPSKANKYFDDVIKYSSKILQFNKDSKYFNKAIYMIAKSYYYKGNYNKALRKFKDLDGLHDPELGLSTKLWLAKSELQMRNFITGMTHLDEVKKIALQDGEDEILFDATVAEISYLIYKENYSQAVAEINTLLNQDLSDEVLAEVTFELGMLQVTLGNYKDAVVAFERVEEGSPSFEIEFKSKLEYAKTIKHLGRNDEALEILNDLRDDDKYEKYWDLVDLEIAQIHLDNGEPEIALEIFYSVDTGYSKNESAGIAAFMQGDIMEHIYTDFDSAKVLYEKVARSKADAEYKTEAKFKVKLLTQRKDYTNKIFTAKREFNYLLDTTLFVKDSTAYAGYMARRDSAMQVAREEEALKNDKSGGRENRGRTRGTAIAKKKMFVYEEDSLFTYEPKLPKFSIDSMKSYIAKNQYELGNLYFSDLLVPDSAFYYYTNTLKDFPNTRYKPNLLYALGSYYLTVNKKDKADSLFRIVYDEYKTNPVARLAALRLGINLEGLNADPVLEKYKVAEDLIDNEKYYDAIEKLKAIYHENPKSEYAPKSLYAVGWIYENQFEDFDSAAEYYDSLKTKYPKSEYVRSISPRLSFYQNRQKAIEDSLLQIKKAYDDSVALVEKALQDSLAKSNPEFLLKTDSTSTVDSLNTSKSDSGKSIKSEAGIVDSVKNSSDKKESQVSDSLKAVNLFERAKKAEKAKKK